MRDLTGKRILITGAGRGLGREFSRTFANAGCEVIVTDIAADRVSESVSLLQSAGANAAGYVMDVTDPQSVRDIRHRLLAERGPVDLLLNNAGVVFGGEFGDIPLERHLATYQINLLGLVTVTHVFLPDLVRQPEAHVINIASASGYIALPFAATYASSKWAVIGFSESLQEELRLAGNGHVRVTTVCPSYIATGMFAGVKLPRFSWFLTPERVADLTVRAVRSNRDFVRTPWFVPITPLAKALMPRALFRWCCDWLNVSTGMTSWRGLSTMKPLADAHSLANLSIPAVTPAPPISTISPASAPAVVTEATAV
jgi:short-subunit dehydrogenase